MFNWKNKKLLILGATNLLIEAVQLAKANEAYVIAMDYLENSPAKKYADEAQLISISDISKVVEFIKARKIDGVFTSFADSILPYYVEIANQANLPCFLTKEQVLFSNDKSFFKDTCKKFNVPVIPEFSDYSKLDFPILVKPVDSSGSRGISTCNNYEEFEKSKNFALEYSKQKKIIVEKFMNCEEITISYTFQDGEIYLTSMHDRFFSTEQKNITKVPNCYIYPSKYLDKYIETANERVIDMLKALDFKNGKIFLQAFADENGFYIYEAGVRLNGCKIYNVINNHCGYNELERMINYALTGAMGKPNLSECANPKFNKYSTTLSYLVKPGVIGKIEGLDKIKNIEGYIHSTLWHNVGETIPESYKGTLSQTVLRVSYSANKLSKLIKIIKQANEAFKVQDENNNNMLLKPYEPAELANIYSEETIYAK